MRDAKRLAVLFPSARIHDPLQRGKLKKTKIRGARRRHVRRCAGSSTNLLPSHRSHAGMRSWDEEGAQRQGRQAADICTGSGPAWREDDCVAACREQCTTDQETRPTARRTHGTAACSRKYLQFSGWSADNRYFTMRPASEAPGPQERRDPMRRACMPRARVALRKDVERRARVVWLARTVARMAGNGPL